MEPDDDLLTTREAAALARVKPATVLAWIRTDGLAALRRRSGRSWRYLISRRALLSRMEHVRPEAAAQSVRLPLDAWTRATLARLGLAECVET